MFLGYDRRSRRRILSAVALCLGCIQKSEHSLSYDLQALWVVDVQHCVRVAFWGLKGITLLPCQLNSIQFSGFLLFRQNLFTVCGVMVSFAL